eukprot:3405896-Amphidinium_carterae.1
MPPPRGQSHTASAVQNAWSMLVSCKAVRDTAGALATSDTGEPTHVLLIRTQHRGEVCNPSQRLGPH